MANTQTSTGTLIIHAHTQVQKEPEIIQARTQAPNGVRRTYNKQVRISNQATLARRTLESFKDSDGGTDVCPS